MKKMIGICLCAVILAFTSCTSEPSLEQYYIANAEHPDFMSFDLPASLLNLEKVDMTEAQKETISSLKKLNVLAFQKKEGNSAEYEVQKTKVKTILKGSDYSELMKINTGYGKATLQLKGDDDSVDEIVIYGDNTEKGFVLIRVLGDDMNPASFVQLIRALEKSDLQGEKFEQLGNFLKG